MSRTAVKTAFDRLSHAVAGRPPLGPLEPGEYAVGHELFEARSDQRANLGRWLAQHLAARGAVPTRVLSIGCGNGSVDVRIATALAAGGHQVDYVGVEPHLPSGHNFIDLLENTAGTHVTLLGSSFADARPEGRYDVVLAVHSLYYVDDLGATLRRACSLLAPGGELVIMHAPRDAMNTLVPLLCPGRRQPFADDVARHLRAMGCRPEITRLDNRLDLTATGDTATDRHLLNFTVQAQVPDALAPAVREALAELALPGPGLVLSHPVDALAVLA